MAGTETTNYDLYKPAAGEKAWDSKVNENFDTIDTQMKTNADAVTAEGVTRAAADVVLTAAAAAKAAKGANTDITSLGGLTTPLSVAQGGTGAATLADGGIVIGNVTGAVEVVAAGTTAQILVGGGASTKPAWGTDLPTAVTIGSAYIHRVGGTDVAVADGGTGSSAAKNTANGVVVLDNDSKLPAVDGSALTALPVPTGSVVQVVNYSRGDAVACNTVIPRDNTIPTWAEGVEVFSLDITPKSATNKLLIDVRVFGGVDLAGISVIAALFQNPTGTDPAIAVGSQHVSEASSVGCVPYSYFMTAGVITELTFKVRVGPNASNCTLNGNGSGAGYFNGKFASSITITEIAG